MNRIAKSIAMIAIVAILAVGATSAVFSDQKTISGNTFSTGTLELKLNHSAGKPFNVTNAYPGYETAWEYMDIYNTGSLPFEANLTINNTGASNNLWNALKIRMKTSGGDSDCTNGDAGENEIYSGLVKNFPASKLVSKLMYWHLANEDDASGSPADNIRAGWSERVCQQVWLPSSAGNEVQGQTVTFDEVVDALQDND